MKNKLIAVFLCVVVLCCAAFATAIAEANHAHLTVVATTYPLYDMACQIGGDHLNVEYQPEPTADSVATANIVLCTGSENDAMLSELNGVTVVYAANGIELIEGDFDFLTIPVNNALCASYFVDALTEADSEHGDMYQLNLDTYMNAMFELDMQFRSAVSNGVKIFCGDGSMAYFANEYGIEIAADETDAVIFESYIYPADEDISVPYIELMERNLEALTTGK